MSDKPELPTQSPNPQEVQELKEKIKLGAEDLINQETVEDYQQALRDYSHEITADLRQKRKTRLQLGWAVLIIVSIYILYVPVIYGIHFFWPRFGIDKDVIIAMLKTVPWAIGLLGVVVVFYHPSKTLDRVLEKLPFGK